MNSLSFDSLYFILITHFFCSADLTMSFEDRVAAVGIATQFQEHSNEVYKMVEEETDFAKTQVGMYKTVILCILDFGYLRKWHFPEFQPSCMVLCREKKL